MSLSTHPFRYTKSLQTLQKEIEPGELAEHLDEAGGPSDFYFRDHNGHLHQIQFRLILEDR